MDDMVVRPAADSQVGSAWAHHPGSMHYSRRPVLLISHAANMRPTLKPDARDLRTVTPSECDQYVKTHGLVHCGLHFLLARTRQFALLDFSLKQQAGCGTVSPERSFLSPRSCT
jgi:hypothetical protein